MEDPRLRILKMLEEGKISAEEAARLLESLEHAGPPKHEHVHHRARHRVHEHWTEEPSGLSGFMRGIGSMVSELIRAVPDVVESSVKTRWATMKQTIPTDRVRRVLVKVMGGDLDIHIRPIQEIQVSGSGMHSVVKRMGEELVIKDMGGDLSLTLPPDKPLALKIMGGDVEIFDLQQKGEWTIMGGDATAHVKELHDLRVKVAGGDLTLLIPREAEFEVEVKVKHERFRFPPGWRASEEEEVLGEEVIFSEGFQGRLQKVAPGIYRIGTQPQAKIRIEIAGGTVEFRERKNGGDS